MISNRTRAIGAILVLASVLGSDAGAQVQTKNQQSCLTAVPRSARKVAGAVLKEAVQCIRKGAAGKLPPGQTAEQCLSADLKSKIAKARAGVAASDLKFCFEAPNFAYTGPVVTAGAYEATNQALTDDAFGASLDTTLDGSDMVDPVGRCSSVLPNVWRKVEDCMHRLFESCVKNGLKAGSITSVAGVEACYDSITDDLRGRVGKVAAQVTTQLGNKCPAGSLEAMFPGLTPICSVYGAANDAAGLAACSRDRIECRTCLMLNDAYGLDRDCDAFDDGNGNGSCPFCGNTVVDSGEGCDDGGNVSGDGCTADCVDEYCGDGVVNDNGAEECDDGPGNSDTAPGACRTNCQQAGCGDGVLDAGEQCDDGNGDDGDCCNASCQYEAFGSPCAGTAGDCVAPACNGAGSCQELPANEGVACDDGDNCTAGSTCQSGVCTADSYSAVGLACNWAVVAYSSRWNNPTPRPARIKSVTSMQSTGGGDWCGQVGEFEVNSAFSGDIVATKSLAGRAMVFGPTVNADGGDIVTGGGHIESSDLIATLPGVATTTVAAGLNVAKTPAPTFYDTTGTDPRVASCNSAQTSLAATAATLSGLASTFDFGNTYKDLPTGPAPTITAINVGGLNVFDMTRLSGSSTNVTITFDGGGDPDTLMILRISERFNTGQYWTFNFTNGMSPDHVIYYVTNGTGDDKCSVGLDNVGGGTLVCPDMVTKILSGTTWYGAAYGGDSSLTPGVEIWTSTLVFTPFTAALPIP